MHDIKEIVKSLASLLETPDGGRRDRLTNAIARESIPGKIRLLGNQVMAVGLGIDRWTVDGECAGLVFVNKDDQEMVWQLELGCQAGPDDLPITATVDDGETRTEIVIDQPGTRRVDLPAVPPDAERLLIIATDKTWSPGTHDQRRLGVNVDVTPTGTLEALLDRPDIGRRAKLRDEIFREAFAGKMRLLGNQIVAAGLSLDHWTQGGVPAALVFTNYDDREVCPELVFSCHAGPDEMPVTVLIEDGQRQRKYVFDQPESRQIALSPVSPHTKRLYIVTTDKTWSPGPGDARRLGVGINISPAWTLKSLQQKPDAYIRVKLAEVIANESFAGKRSLLGDLIVAVGLTGDHWTEGGAPAAVVVTNTLDQKVVPEVVLTCNASPEELPITAVVDDGQQSKAYVLDAPGSVPVSLSPVPHHSRRLYIVSTDRAWSPGSGDERQLGVRVDISPLGMLRSLAERDDPKVWSRLAGAMAVSALADTTDLADGRAKAQGLSPDGWTMDGEPAGLVVENLDGDNEAVWELSLGCHAGPDELPITATVEDGQSSQQVVFDAPGSRQVALSPVPAGEASLYLVTCDKTWSPGGGDERRLGVIIDGLKRSLSGTLGSLLAAPHEGTRAWAMDAVATHEQRATLDGGAVAVGLSGDGWTLDGEPAGLVIDNPEGDRDRVLDLNLTCHASPDDLPITALVDDGEEKKEIRFSEAGSRLLTLAPVPAGGKRLFIISTDRTWSPGTETDDRVLGVHVAVEE